MFCGYISIVLEALVSAVYGCKGITKVVVGVVQSVF